jgi:hypothetical protein
MDGMKTSAVQGKQGSSRVNQVPERPLKAICVGLEQGDRIMTPKLCEVRKVVKDAKLTVDEASGITVEFADGSGFNVDILGKVKSIASDYLDLERTRVPREMDFLRNKTVEHIIVDPGNEEDAKSGCILFICHGGDKLTVEVNPGSIQRIESQ